MGNLAHIPEIRILKIKDINPSVDNPRDISSEALNGLRSSIQKFGYLDLLIVNKRNMSLISGHQRMKVLESEGIEEIHCILVDLDDLQEKALNLTMNNQQIAGYFTAAVIPILEELRNTMPDDYINLRLQELREDINSLEEETIGLTMPDDIPNPPDQFISKFGDLWILGDHRLLCGDSTNENDVTRLMDGNQAQLFATDPPYLVDYTGKDRPGGGKDWSDQFKEYEIKDGRAFIYDFYNVGLKYVEENAALYIWHASSRVEMILSVYKELNLLPHQFIIWVKPATVLTFSIYPWRHEPCLFGWKKGKKPFFRPNRKNIGTVWKIDFLRSLDPATPEYYTDIWEVDWNGKGRPPGGMHPTVKPVEVFSIPIRVHTKPGDICYEPFCGSGSQIIAAEKLNRRCFAMEKEPVFVDVAVKRWEEFTGKKAILK